MVGHATTGTLSSAIYNTGVGIGALDALTSGNNNTAMGRNAGTAFTTAGRNTAIGTNALSISSTNGDNTAVGRQSLKSCIADGNTALGKDAGEGITSGVNNIVIGLNSADNLTTGSGNVIIGADIDTTAVNSARTLKIAGNDGSTTTTWISGDSNGQVKLISGYVLEVALTDASTITWNAATQPVAKVTLGANRTMGLPANSVNGQFISLLIIQDGTGSRTITWNAAYEFALDTAPTLTATANLGDLFTFRYNGAKWLEVGRNLALTLS